MHSSLRALRTRYLAVMGIPGATLLAAASCETQPTRACGGVSGYSGDGVTRALRSEVGAGVVRPCLEALLDQGDDAPVGLGVTLDGSAIT